MSVYRWIKRKLGLRVPPRIIGPDGVVWQAPNGTVMVTVTAAGGGGAGGIAVPFNPPPYPMTLGNCGVGSRVYHPNPSGGVGGGVAFPEDYIVRGQRHPAGASSCQAVNFGQLIGVAYGSAGGLPPDCHSKDIDPTKAKQ